MERVELACHTGYSRKNGIGFGREWVNYAIRNNIDTLVITDCGNVDSFVDMQRAIYNKKANIKLIMGVDIIVLDDIYTGCVGRFTVLIRNEIGRKNLYEMLSKGEMDYKANEPELKMPLSLLINKREGLLVGSGTQDSLLIKAIERLKDKEYDFLDYIEIPSSMALTSHNEVEKLLEFATEYNIPAAVVDAPHYRYLEEGEAYSILKNTTVNEGRYYKYTEELLDSFDYLGEDKAYELVVENSRKIADMCNTVDAVPNIKLYPYVENQDELLESICERAMPDKYPDASLEIRDRVKWELEAIKSTQSAFMFLQVKYIFDELKLQPYEVGSRGMMASSIVAYLCGISEVDPIKANLSPFFMFGFNGNKIPDLDLNFRFSIRDEAQKILETAPGVGSVIKAGTLGCIYENSAIRMIQEYSKANDRYYDEEEYYQLIDTLGKSATLRGQHPGGLILLPKGIEITDVFPITTVNTGNGLIATSGFEYHSIDFQVYKLDVLSHDSPEMLTRLYKLTGVDPRNISIDDEAVMEMFKSHDNKMPECAGIPEFTSDVALKVLEKIKPQSFDDLVKYACLVHGTDTWYENAETLIDEENLTIKEVIGSRDDVYDTLLKYDIDNETAYKIADYVRKGLVKRGRVKEWQEFRELMQQKGVPEWFVWSCERISYMFPRAHAYAYILSSFRLAWYKLHYPAEFNKVMEAIRDDNPCKMLTY